MPGQPIDTIPRPPHRPRVVITAGDPTGIGPEVIAGVWSETRVHRVCRPVVLGQEEVLARAAELRGLNAEMPAASNSKGGALDPGSFDRSAPDLMPILNPDPQRDEQDPSPGGEAYGAIHRAIELALAGECDAIVTAPISKANLQAAGHDYPGHTELLAELCGVEDFAMMLYLPPGETTQCRHGLGVVHVTLHTSLRSVFDLLSTEKIVAKCHLADRAMRSLGVEAPRLAVAALNPHAGEGGLFGDEEANLIRPAVEQAAAEGLDVVGPAPTDTLMGRARAGEFDAVVAMYHDQGHIALKTIDMHAAVNITLGLPIVRTSVAHGTAPDLAWKGVAETAGMVAAIETAASLAQRRKD